MYLSNDIICYLINFLNKNDNLKFNILSKHFNNYTNSNIFWKKFYKQEFGNYLFDVENQNWKKNFIEISKLSHIHFKILKVISQTKINIEYNTKEYSSLDKIKWIKNKENKNKLKLKIRTVVHNHKEYGYFITSIYLINYNELYLSVYFVNNSKSIFIYYKN